MDDADFKLRHAGTDDRAERQATLDVIKAKVQASNYSTEAPAATP